MSVRSLPRPSDTPDVPNVRYVLLNENVEIQSTMIYRWKHLLKGDTRPAPVMVSKGHLLLVTAWLQLRPIGRNAMALGEPVGPARIDFLVTHKSVGNSCERMYL